MAKFYAAIVTNGGNVPLLNRILWIWKSVGVDTVVVTHEQDAKRVDSSMARVVVSDVSPQSLGDARQVSLDVYPERYALTTDDDVMPLLGDWTDPGCEPGAIRSIRLISVLGQRWGDWAYYDPKRGIFNQPYNQTNRGTYITGAAQLIAPEVRKAVSYRNRAYRGGNDIFYCHDAVKAGFKLLPPKEGAPELLHMDRLKPHPSDPDRYGTRVA